MQITNAFIYSLIFDELLLSIIVYCVLACRYFSSNSSFVADRAGQYHFSYSLKKAGPSESTVITIIAYMHLNSKSREEIRSSFSRQRFETLECETDLQLSPGDIVEVKFEIFDDLGYLVCGHFSGCLNASSAGA